jgi:hypothetical protein
MKDEPMKLKNWALLLFFFLPFYLFCPLALADWMFAVVGDTREDFKYGQVFPEMIKEINATTLKMKDREMKAEFLLHLGDLELGRGNRESLERCKERLKGLKVKYYLARGNRELVERKDSSFSLPSIHQILKENQDFSREHASFFDLKETYYSFDYRDLHVIVLDNSVGTFQTLPGEEIHSEQLRWLERDLEETAGKIGSGGIRHTIICAHLPPPSPAPEVTTYDMLEYVNRHYVEGKVLAEGSARIFWQILERYRYRSQIRHLFFAHDRRYVSYHQRGFPVTITGGGGAPLIAEERGGFYHYLEILVSDGGLKERIIRSYPQRRLP